MHRFICHAVVASELSRSVMITSITSITTIKSQVAIRDGGTTVTFVTIVTVINARANMIVACINNIYTGYQNSQRSLLRNSLCILV
jgi:hypothetical protein